MKKYLFLFLSIVLLVINVFGQTNVIQNGSFEDGSYDITPWTISDKFWIFSANPCDGKRVMLTADGKGEAYASLTNEYVQQTISIPSNSTSATLNFQYKLNTDNVNSGVTLQVWFGSTKLATYDYASSNYKCKNISIPISNISSFSGKNVTIKFVANESSSNSYWGKVYVDDVSLDVTYTSGTNSTAPTSAAADPPSVTSGNSSTLTVSGGSLGTGASWKWYSGSCGGTYIKTGSSISVSPTSTTTYFVRAEGTNNITTCTSTEVRVTENNTNSTAPTSAAADPQSITSGNSSTLTVSGGSLGTGASWKWYSGNCGGTYVKTGSSISVNPSSTTTYFVRAEGTSNTTTCKSIEVRVTENNTNSTAPTSAAADPPSITSGNSSTLTVSGGSLGTGASWKWYSGNCGGTYVKTGSSISVNPSSTTTYFVRAEGTSNTTTCANTTVYITKESAPVAAFFSKLNDIKPNTTVQFWDKSENIPTSWQWTFEGATPSKSNEQNPKVTYKTPGTFKVKLTVSNGLGSDNKTIAGYITVSPDATNQLTPSYKYASNAFQYLIADPIQTGTGSYQYSHKDFNLPTVNGVVNFTRFYNTINNNLNGSLGYGWSHSYNYYIDIQRDDSNQTDTIWSVHYPDGHFADFIPYYSNQETYPRFCFALYSGTLDSLVKINSSEFILYSKDNRKYHFNDLGQLTQITDLNNNATTITYSDGKISSVVGQGGRTIKFTYSGSYLSSVSDPNNRNCNFNYDANGNLISSYDPNGGITKFKYDAHHRMTAFINSLGDTIVKNSFDAQGRVIVQKDAYNQTTTLNYDTPSAGYTTITNPDKSQTVVYHDNFFRKTNIKDELGLTKSYTYDYNGNETGFTNENGVSLAREFDWNRNIKSQTIGSNVTTRYDYNDFNTPKQIEDPHGKSTFLTYNAQNNLTSIHLPDDTYQYFTPNSDGTRNKYTDGRNNSTTYTYSNSGDILSLTTINGTKTFGYDPAGRLISVTDENNHQTKISYDDNDNIKVITDALLRTLEFTYDANNQLLITKDKNGNVTKYTYDKKGRLKTNTNPMGGVTFYNYDSRDNITSVKDPNGNITSFTYDKKGRKLNSTDAFGETKYEYDGVGNLTKVTDASGKATEYEYTITNKTKSVKDGLMNTTLYTYDKNDNLISILNALNDSTVYSYDEMNRLVSVLDADNKKTTITYDENGNKKTVTDPNEHTQSFGYNAANSLDRHFDALKYEIRYEYDKAENILSIKSPTGTISKTYDEANRLLTVTNSSGDNYSFTYDKNDNITAMHNKTGTTVMVYDSLNLLIKYSDPFNKTVTFTYDLMGNKTSVTYPGNHKVTYKYDSSNRLKTVTDWLNNTFTYIYDAAGRNTQLVYPNGIKCDIEFDNAARVLSKQNATNNNAIINSSRFELDAVGNRLSELKQGAVPTNLVPSNKVYSYAENDGMKSNAVWNYTNDATGNRITETKGNKSAKYSFSVDNLLTSFNDTLGATTTFEYNPLGHRLSKTEGTTQSRFVLDLSSSLTMVLQITDASGVIKSEYVYGLGLLESIDPSNNVTFYHFDAQHNTVALSNQNAAITDTYTYDPFGTVLTHTGNTKQPFTFLGEFGVEQENTSMYFVRARYYDASNGRFLSRDVYPGNLNDPQTINRYVYSTNNPIMKFDPSGLYGNQDNTLTYVTNFFLNGESFLSDVTDNFGFYSLEASFRGFGELGNINLGKVGKTMEVIGIISDLSTVVKTTYDYQSNKISATEAGLSNFVTGFPYLTTAIGTSLGGVPGGIVGGWVGNVINSVGKGIGNAITNTTWGLNASTWLLDQLK